MDSTSLNNRPTDTTAPLPGLSTQIKASDTLILYRINGTYFKSIWEDAKYTVSRPIHWEKKDWITFGAVMGTASVLAVSDYPIKEFFQKHQYKAVNSFAHAVEPFGNAYSPYLIGGMYLTGVLTHNRKLEHGGLMAAKSLVLSTAIYAGIKSIIRRGRPYYFERPYNFVRPFSKDERFTSFPSGHSLTVMTFATAMAELYGKDHKWVPWVAYGLAGLTGLSRIYHNRHWSSDVLIGLSLGHFVTKSVFRRHKEMEHKKALQFKFTPLY
ncbi:phosphatase PAP2 family protein [Chitinophaga caeni]|uniref:phosphatase PAP2 family protein n=1 Tax=Chitinophaga caeni TaxID=2029983 RepID=UPI001E430498|nr:phosphatase PAP2 family protein [Chitinophaga caeni]